MGVQTSIGIGGNGCLVHLAVGGLNAVWTLLFLERGVSRSLLGADDSYELRTWGRGSAEGVEWLVIDPREALRTETAHQTGRRLG